MHISGHVNGTFAVYRIPCRRVGRAKKLNLQTKPGHGRFNGQSFDLFRRIPCGTAGCAFQYLNMLDDMRVMFNLYSGCTKKITVFPKTVLP